MRAGLYVRVSTTEQAEEGYSIEAQLEAMRRFCEERGWTVASEYIEPGVTGTIKDRPAFQRALHDCEAGRLDVLLTHRLDRFYRNLRFQLETLAQLAESGVAYVSTTEQIDYSTPQGKMFMQMLGAFNEYYVANLSREVKKGKKGRAEKGLSNASTLPYGYIRQEGCDLPKPDAERESAVLLAFETYATGQHTDQDIADLLNREGYPSYQREWEDRETVNHWTRSTVRKMLQNPFYAGLVRYGKELHDGQHKPMISPELFDQAQAVRAERGKHVKGGRRSGRVYLLHRVARCQHCGGIMHMEYKYTRNQYEYKYYRCSAAVNGLECKAAGRTVRTDVIDGQVAALIKRLALPDDWRERLAELAEHREERENLEGRRNYLRGKLRRLRELYLDGDFGKPEYNQRKEELQAQLDALQVPEQPAIEEAGETLEELGAVWVGAPLRIQRDMLRVIFEAVYVDVLGQRLVRVKPYPQFAPLFRMDELREKEGCFYVGEEGEEVGPKG